MARAAATSEEGGSTAAGDERVAATATLVAAVLVVGSWNALTDGHDRFNPDVEGSVFQLVTAAVTAIAAVAAVAHAAFVRARRIRFAALGAALAYVTADDLLVVHERISESFGERVLGLQDHVAVRLWIVLFAPLLLVILFIVAAEARRAVSMTGRILAGGLVALLGAVVVEAAGAVTHDPDFIDGVSGKPETARYLLEEALELGGWALVAGGLTCVLTRDAGAFRG